MTGWKALPRHARSFLLRRDVLPLLVILLLALALRLTWIHFVNPAPNDGRLDDSAVYHQTAVDIIHGRGFQWVDRYSGPPGGPLASAPTAFWGVGYPLILAGIYSLFGVSIFAAKTLNVLLSVATCLLAYLVGRQVFDRRVGLAAAAVLAFFPSQVYFSTVLMTEVTWTFFAMLFLYLVLRFTIRSISWQAAALLGLLLGAASLIRGEMLLFPLVLIAVWALAHHSLGKALRYGAITFAAVAVALLPWTIRNWVVLGYPVAVSTGSADNLLAGHWSGANGIGSFVPGLALNEKYSYLLNPEREVKIYREEIHQAVSFAVHNPGKELQLIPEKLRYFYREDSRPLLLVQVYRPALDQTAEDRLSNVANVYYYLAIAAAALGAPLWFSLRDPKKLLILALILYYSVLFGFVFIGEERFHSALIPALSILAAASLISIGERVRDWAKRPPAAEASG
ncbi:MAG: glycosyltransferase family 39 protein [Dehalococcoidia bacterium]|jgi:4-amino-4-deoxy-L-arabinose transferase-like glycosyltransferase